MAKKKTEQARATTPSPVADWGTAAGRVRWLVETRYKSNRSAFAAAIKVSHTAINKVVTGDREPGRKLLAAIARELGINPTWLLTGQGQPGGGPSGLPISQQLLPGPPLEHLALLSGRWVDLPGQLFTPSQYLLEVASSEPILREPRRGFRVGDQLLMDTDRTRFPREQGLEEHLCIVRLSGKDPPLRLAEVTHYDVETGLLEVDTFDQGPDKPALVREEVYRHYPDGQIRHSQRQFKLVQSPEGKRSVLVPPGAGEPMLPMIQYADIVAVWVQILRRPMGIPY